MARRRTALSYRAAWSAARKNAALFRGGTASAAATRVERRNCALRFVPFARRRSPPARTRSVPRRSSASSGLGRSRHAPAGAMPSARITGHRIAAMRTFAPSWCNPTGRSRTGGRIRCRPAARPGRGRTKRRTAFPIGATSEPRDQRQNQNTSGGGADGVGDEYAISAAANPAADQSAHRRSTNSE
jgi:hypothetical protein